jgi:MscS family membrane protein
MLTGLVAADGLCAQAVGPRDSTRVDSSRAKAAEANGDVSPASPRSALEQFLSLARAGRYGDAAAYLELADSVRARSPVLARQLKAVLDRHLWVDLDRASPLAVGDTADGLPPRLEHVGTIRSPDGVRAAIRLVRSAPRVEPSWRFARSTVDLIPGLYATLDDRWILEHLPAVLLRPGPLELLRWQWLALPLLLAVAALVGLLASRLIRAGLGRIAARTATEWDNTVLSRVGGPLTAAMTLVVASALLPWLALYAPAAEASYRVIRVAFFITFFWAIWRLVDVTRHVMSRTSWAQRSASSRALLPLAGRVTKVVLLAIAAVAVLSMLGYPVASLVAGLGLGGLALALAAQKTVENLFGAFSIGIDQPFREGDFVRIEEFVGTVEAIGLRSSRFRTLDRTLITIPNGRLADMRLESFTARDRLRLATVIGLVYETTASQMRQVLAGFERTLREHPKIWPDTIVVRFREFAASSLDIEIMAWFQTSDWGQFQFIRQEVLLAFMDVVEKAGSSFAFPTQTLHVASVPGGASRSEESPRAGTEQVSSAGARANHDNGAA